MQAGAADATRGALRALQANAAYWQSDYGAARLLGENAIATCSAGSREWFSAVGSTIVAPGFDANDAVHQEYEVFVHTATNSNQMWLNFQGTGASAHTVASVPTPRLMRSP